MLQLVSNNPEFHISDKRFYRLAQGVGWSVVILFGALILSLIFSSQESIVKFGIGFLWDTSWDPIDEYYGALTFAYGTLITSILALAISAPPCIALALFTTEICHQKFRGILSFLIEMLAAIPSIIYGTWALFILAPLVREVIFPICNQWLPAWGIVQGPSFGLGILTSSLILAIMVSPIIATICIEVFKAVPVNQRYAALALGATRWEMFKIALLKPGAKGILGGMILGLGRALGETMAVAMVIGNAPEISASLFGPGATMASVIANEYAEAVDDLHLSSLNYVALILFLITFLVNILAKKIVNRASGMAKQ